MTKEGKKYIIYEQENKVMNKNGKKSRRHEVVGESKERKDRTRSRRRRGRTRETTE